MNQEPRVNLSLLKSHFDFITNLLGQAPYVQSAPIINDISQQLQAQAQAPQAPPAAE
jgi:hypothetical protein